MSIHNILVPNLLPVYLNKVVSETIDFIGRIVSFGSSLNPFRTDVIFTDNTEVLVAGGSNWDFRGDLSIFSSSDFDVNCDINLATNKKVNFGASPFLYSSLQLTCDLSFTGGSISYGTIPITLIKCGNSVTLIITEGFDHTPGVGTGYYEIDVSVIVGTEYQPQFQMAWLVPVFSSSTVYGTGLLTLSNGGIITITESPSPNGGFPGASSHQGLTSATSITYYTTQ